MYHHQDLLCHFLGGVVLVFVVGGEFVASIAICGDEGALEAEMSSTGGDGGLFPPVEEA
jgi:hypothetical protein